MGVLKYDSSLEIPVEDRLLHHLQIVIGAKLRRQESFYFTFVDGVEDGFVSECVWIHPSVPLAYMYEREASTTINRQWLEALNLVANSNSGLRVIEEPAETD